MINLSRNRNICCGLKKFVAKKARVNFEQQIVDFIKLTTCHATNLQVLRGKLRVVVSRNLPPKHDHHFGSKNCTKF